MEISKYEKYNLFRNPIYILFFFSCLVLYNVCVIKAKEITGELKAAKLHQHSIIFLSTKSVLALFFKCIVLLYWRYLDNCYLMAVNG